MSQDRADLPIGETVDVTLHGAVVVTNAPLVVRLGGAEVTVPNGPAGVVDVDVVAPVNWPPIRDDVWAGGSGVRYHAVQIADKVKLVSGADGSTANPNTVRVTDRPLTLVFRT